MAGRLLASVTLLLSGLGAVAAAPRKGEDFFLGVPVSNPDAPNPVPHKFIVVYNNTFDHNVITAHEASITAKIAKRNINKRSPRTGRFLSTTVHPFNLGGQWHALALEADDRMITEIFTADEVAYIEQDQYITVNRQLVQGSATTGLARLSHARVGSRGYVFDDTAGQGITAYVVDTGIRVTHSEFEGRAVWGENFVNDVDTDENGHGTHVAGTIGGKTYGVAKNVELVAVKVLDQDGSGTNSGVLAGMDFVVANATARGLRGKAVMNMSLGGSTSRALNSAINAIFNAGVVPVVAAGNENQDTRNTSPGSAELAITVGAIDQTTDDRASFSNFGTGVDIFAPGVNVLSCGIENDSATDVLSGTSMASPHVAGLAAYIMALEGLTDPQAVRDRIVELAEQTGAEVGNNRGQTTNLIANNGNLN